ncbi:MAG: hypothetical protein JW934_04020 [Anaerolineae bacterium]|nr:hypothetical protein [Anaerolineae bacterium]
MKLYHIVPQEMRGTILYPLNRMQEVFPEIYEQERQKYAGREEVAATYIPVLNCHWVDVVQMFAVPTHVIQRRQQLRGGKPLRFFEIESDRLDQFRLCAWLDDFVLFGPHLPVDRVSPESEALFERRLREQGSARLFIYLPHILYQREIDVSACRIVV